ncbi:hypothetical protein FACS1894208_12510 [Clostridia bacterium]|nr:hypothetical protein FACS1894208_12510 [Clostridia bacterium]
MSCDFDSYKNTKGRHEGIDFTLYKGATIYSLITGKVTRVYVPSSGLSTITIYDSVNNKTVVYLHSASAKVNVGQTVARGQAIAVESDRGARGSPHTHIEVRNGNVVSAAKSVNDDKLENSNPYSYWAKVLF